MKNIKINNLYLKSFEIDGVLGFSVDIVLTNKKDEANLYKTEDISKILQILKVFGYDKIFVEEEDC